MSLASLEHTVQARQQIGQQTVLNAYEIRTEPLQWLVNVYRVEALTPHGSAETPGGFKTLLYDYGRRARLRTPGPFWILDAHHLATPADCVLPATEDFRGHRITPLPPRTIDGHDPAHEALVREILKSATRDALKRGGAPLNDLIQDGTRFIERPGPSTRRGELHYCRRYEVRPRPIRLLDGTRRWTLQMVVDTVSLDVHPIGDYYRRGTVNELAEMIGAKRRNRSTRAGEPTAIRALYLPEGSAGQFGPLVDPERIMEDAEYKRDDQPARGERLHPCRLFRRGEQEVISLPGESLHLILDTQITGEGHDDTILHVSDRLAEYRSLHNMLHGAEAYGVQLDLAPTLATVMSELVRPPALKLRGRVLEAPREVTFNTLQDRARARANHVRTHGYLYRPSDINPLVAVPVPYGQARGEQLVRDLQEITNRQGLEVRIAGPVLYNTVEDLKRQLGHHDALIAVLPEGRASAQHTNDMHEQIKKALSVTSQCIQFDNTRRLRQDTPKQSRNAGFNYEAVLLNLLVKHGWIPFLPAEAARYNVRFGIDVGGVLNDRVMVCLGYGFEEATPIFHAEEIEVGREQAEPIQDGPLYAGMIELLAQVRRVIAAKRITPNFNRVLFFRDGDSNGEAGVWQERDAFDRLHAEFLRQGWVDDRASWVLVEVSKRAAGWRHLRQEEGRTMNPLVGTVSFPFDDPNQALVSTTGSPTLSQGTAQPLLVTMTAIAGTFDPQTVVRDLVWEADLGFTKLDQGYALPFTLHVADSGALQLSRTYDITGLTV
jgi:hypothetical protein